MKGDKVFVDTNILIYAYDTSAGRKNVVAGGILKDLWISGHGAISIQVLQEFYVNVTRKIANPISRESAREIVADFMTWEVIVTEKELLLDAIEKQARYQLSFWDAMIVSAADAAGADVLLSEDLNDGQRLGKMAIKNPFIEHKNVSMGPVMNMSITSFSHEKAQKAQKYQNVTTFMPPPPGRE